MSIRFRSSLFVFFIYSSFFIACQDGKVNSDSDGNGIASGSNTLIYCIENPPLIGEFDGIEMYEGGISGMFYIPGSDMEFYLINDRGPNMVMNNHPKADGQRVKLFPFPQYSPKIMRAKIEDGQLIMLDFKTFTGPDGEVVTGVPAPDIMEEVAEIAWADLDGTVIPPDEWGIDAEAIALDKDGNFWIAEEYRTSIWHIDASTMKVINRYTPEPRLDIDIAIPAEFAFRRPNRGFESLTITPGGWVFAMLQSPMWFPNPGVGEKSRLIRVLAINPKTNDMAVYGYEIPDAQGSVRIRDWKIADMTAINEYEFLILEHGSRGDDFFADLYIMSIAQAAPIPEGVFDDLTFEQLNTAEMARRYRLRLTQKRHFINLFDFGYSRENRKPEGLAIIDAQTIAIITDNDYSVDAPHEDANLVDTAEKTCLYLIHLPDSLQLKLN